MCVLATRNSILIITLSFLTTSFSHSQVDFTKKSEIGIVINEFMAQNNAFIKDEAGQFEDWIEFYNLNDHEVDLSGFFLTDDALQPAKWQFPLNTKIAANGYLVVWADKHLDQGPLHADIKLSASGEEILLTDKDLQLVDHYVFGQQVANKGCARMPNGTGNFVIQEATFGTNNEGSENGEHELSVLNMKPKLKLNVYPNPSTGFFSIETPSQTGELQLFDITGQLIFSQMVTDVRTSIHLAEFTSGSYLVTYEGKQTKLILIH